MRLHEWLAHQQAQHPKEIELGLTRVREVAERLGLLPWRVPSVIVGGTNGKGSTVAFLAALAQAEGLKVGAYTSPHLQRYNERVAVNNTPVSDTQLEDAFTRIESARAEIPLTFFEYGTLAALLIFADEAAAGRLDIALIEVGLGGRLDATNIIDAEVTVITSIGLDHMDWLGPTVEHIGREKAHIARAGRPVILGPDMPASVHATLKEIGACPEQLGVDFPALELQQAALAAPVQAINAALALAAYRALRAAMGAEAAGTAVGTSASTGVESASLMAALARAAVAGRLQRHREVEGPEWILDVAHNAPAAEALAAALAALPRPGQRYAVVGIFADKDAEAIARALTAEIDGWILCGLPGPRGGDLEGLRARLPQDLRCLALAPTVTEGCALARALAAPGDQILVCGSFQIVGPALDWLGL